MALENNFSWSKSRDEEFRDCKRKYFYSRYASWGGWERDAPKEARLAYVLKNIKNRWAWKGETVHHVIEDLLKSLRAGRPLGPEASLARLTEVMRRDYRSSKSKKYCEDPKRNLGLFEHEYEKGITDEGWKKIHDGAADCLQNFLKSGFYQELLGDDKTAWLAIEDLEEFDFEGAKIYVKLDFARRREDRIEIYDWKTGRGDGPGIALQMGAYALYAMQKWKKPVESLSGYILNLSAPNPELKNQPLTADLIEDARRLISESIRGMKELLADPVRNVPKPRENFPFTDDLRLCDACNFYKICEKYNG